MLEDQETPSGDEGEFDVVNGFDAEAARVANEPDEDDVDDGDEPENGDLDDQDDDDTSNYLGDEEDEDGDQDDSDDLDDDTEEDRPRKDAKGDRDADRFITIKVDGKPKQITVREAAEGYMRTADYTRKTQATAEQKRLNEALHAQLTAQVEQYSQLLDEALGSVKPEDLEKLRTEDPQQYLLVKDQLKAVEDERKRVQSEAQKLAEAKQAEEDKALAEFRAKENEKLFAALPHWSDAKVREREVRAISQGLLDAGVTPEELNDPRSVVLNDHRFILFVRDALLWRRQQAAGQGKRKVRPVPAGKTLRPGARPADRQGQGRGLRQARARLARTGSQRDAAALFENIPGLLDGGKKPRKR